MNHMHKPFIIVLEGIDGAGKTTQADLLEQSLRQRDVSVTTTGVFRTTYGQHARKWFMDQDVMAHADLRTQVFLLASAMNQTLEEIERGQGAMVIIDRFVYTTMAYHGGGLQMGIDAVQEIYASILERFHPDLALFLDLPVELIPLRRQPTDRIERHDAAFFHRVRDAYTTIMTQLGAGVIIDATQTAETVHDTIMAHVWNHYAARTQVPEGGR